MFKLLIGYLLILIAACQQDSILLDLKMLVPREEKEETIISNGSLDSDFSDTVYNEKFCCKTELYILELYSS